LILRERKFFKRIGWKRTAHPELKKRNIKCFNIECGYDNRAKYFPRQKTDVAETIIDKGWCDVPE